MFPDERHPRAKNDTGAGGEGKPGPGRAKATTQPAYRVETLDWRDVILGSVDTPAGPMQITLGLGSGLAQRMGGYGGIVWAIGDRGPNLKVPLAIEKYGLAHLASKKEDKGAKIMPRVDIGPMICKLKVGGGVVKLLDVIPIRDRHGKPISGLPIPRINEVKAGREEESESVYGLDGGWLGADPSGADTESIAVLKDGSFWVGDEYGPSLLQLSANGTVLRRLVPKGTSAAFEGAQYPIEAVLPKITARRRLNRGFEALAVSNDERWLYVVFQSALTTDDPALREEDAQEQSGRFVRIWKLDAQTGKVAAQFLYPFDEPTSFKRDGADASWRDLKVCEAFEIGQDRLLLLERISKTAKLYIVDLSAVKATPKKYLKVSTRPELEALSPTALNEAGVHFLEKRLVLSTDDATRIGSDLEGLVVMSPTELILVNDNDFGVDGAKTGFWKVTFDDPVFI